MSVSEEVRCRCHLKYNNYNHNFNMVNSKDSNKNNPKNSNNAENKKVTQFSNISLMTQSPSNDSLLNEDNNNCLKFESNDNMNSSFLVTNNQPKRQKSCDVINNKLASSSNLSTTNNNFAQNQQQQKRLTKPSLYTNMLCPPASSSTLSTTPPSLLSSTTSISSATPLLNPINYIGIANNKTMMKKSITIQNQQTLNNLQNKNQPSNFSSSVSSQKFSDTKTTENQNNENSRNNIELNVLLDPGIINDYPTQALLLTVLATLVRNTTDENETRILYQYIAEASIVFSKVFPVIHNLLDSKINHIIQLSMDESILDSVQSIIQNMISSCEMSDSNQQQLSYLQSCGFGGLWRFAQPFSIGREKPENVELFVDCLEALVETCLPPDNETFSVDSNSCLVKNENILSFGYIGHNNSINSINHSLNTFSNNVASNYHLNTGSMSSISMSSLYSPMDLNGYDLNDSNRTNKEKMRRNSSPKNIM